MTSDGLPIGSPLGASPSVQSAEASQVAHTGVDSTSHIYAQQQQGNYSQATATQSQRQCENIEAG